MKSQRSVINLFSTFFKLYLKEKTLQNTATHSTLSIQVLVLSFKGYDSDFEVLIFQILKVA